MQEDEGDKSLLQGRDGLSIEVDHENWVSFRVGATLLTLRPRGQGLAWDDGTSVSGSAALQLALRVPPQPWMLAMLSWSLRARPSSGDRPTCQSGVTGRCSSAIRKTM